MKEHQKEPLFLEIKGAYDFSFKMGIEFILTYKENYENSADRPPEIIKRLGESKNFNF